MDKQQGGIVGGLEDLVETAGHDRGISFRTGRQQTTDRIDNDQAGPGRVGHTDVPRQIIKVRLVRALMRPDPQA